MSKAWLVVQLSHRTATGKQIGFTIGSDEVKLLGDTTDKDILKLEMLINQVGLVRAHIDVIGTIPPMLSLCNVCEQPFNVDVIALHKEIQHVRKPLYSQLAHALAMGVYVKIIEKGGV